MNAALCNKNFVAAVLTFEAGKMMTAKTPGHEKPGALYSYAL